jgi:type IV secretory pathway ATPase VirB11/archaellum biosynthesis ATPase
MLMLHFDSSFDAVEGELVNLVKKNGTLVVIGETGSGKTTRKLAISFFCVFCFSYLFEAQVRHLISPF